MRISEKGIALIKEFEGCELTAYRCPSNVLTIGWGHTSDVYEGQTITQEEANNLLVNDMIKYENYVNDCNVLTFVPNQNQFDALVSFTYNCGQGNLVTLVQNRSADVVAEKLLLYINGSNGILEGLVRRRKAERELFLNCDYVQTVKKEVDNVIETLQSECNAQGFSSQSVDGIAGINTLNGCPTLRNGAKGIITHCLQLLLQRHGYPLPQFGSDSNFGAETLNAVILFQNDNGLNPDGIVGRNTWKKLLNI